MNVLFLLSGSSEVDDGASACNISSRVLCTVRHANAIHSDAKCEFDFLFYLVFIEARKGRGLLQELGVVKPSSA